MFVPTDRPPGRQATRMGRRTRRALLSLLAGLLLPSTSRAQTRDPGFTIEDVLSPAFRYGLVAAANADRIAWIENDGGRRNVYTAAAPDYTPVMLTSTAEDDAIDHSGLQLSADGSILTYIRGHAANFKGQYGNQGSHATGGIREVWAVATSKPGETRRVAEATAGQLSPDGKWFAYVKDAQIHRAPVDPAADSRETDAAPPLFVTLGENSNPVWSPDGNAIAFVSARYDQRQYFPTQGAVTTHSFITVYDIPTGRISYMAPSVDTDTSPVWSPDGRSIAFIRRPGLPFGHFATDPLETITRAEVPAGFLEAAFAGGHTLEFWVADVATGTARTVWKAPVGSALSSVNSIRWAESHLYFESEADGWRHGYSVALDGSTVQPTLLTPGEGEIEQASLSSDGRWLYFTANFGDLDSRHLWRVPVGGGSMTQLSSGATLETVLAPLGSGGQVAVQQSGPSQPVAIALVPAEGGAGKIVSSPPPSSFPGARHVTPQSVELIAADGLKSRAILFLPSDLVPGEKRPAILYIHGGGGRFVLGYPDQSNGFYHMSYGVIQYLVNKGYIVAAVNYRGGSALYGSAFRNPENYSMNGVSEYRDVLAAGLHLKNRPDVDAERIGVFGLSYGGWLTGQALSRNSDLFKAGAIFAGVQLRSTSLDPSNIAYQSSPAFNIDKWTSPTLVIHGDDDRNVEFSQTIGLINLFRARGIPHELIVYPDDTHYFGYYHRWVRAFNAIDDFFDRNLIGNPGGMMTSSLETDAR